MDKNIQWFPGHIAKGRKDVLGLVKNVDLLIEVLDSRCIASSKQDDYLFSKGSNANKPILYVLNKIDLADPVDLIKWEEFFVSKKLNYCTFSSTDNKDSLKLLKCIKNISKNIREKYQKKGIKNKIVRCLIFGIPNVGKSTIINRLIHKNRLVVKNVPGVTRKINEIKLDESTHLYDTAGILPTVFVDQIVAKKVCLINSISSKTFSYVELSKYLFNYLESNYKNNLIKYIKSENFKTYSEFIEMLRINRNILLKKDNEIDSVCEIFVRDFQMGKIGKISLEKCEKILTQNFIKNTNI